MPPHPRPHSAAPGLRDHLVTEELASLLSTVDPDSQVRRNLGAAEALERTAKHLMQAARRMRSPSAPGQFQEHMAAINAAITALGTDVIGDQVPDPPQVLLGILPPAGIGGTSLPPHPSLPLTESELMVGASGEPSLAAVLKDELRSSLDVDLLCAFVGWTGFEPLKDEFRDVITRGGRVRVVTSTYLGATSAKAVHALRELGAEVKINYNGQATKLHAKAWMFHRDFGLATAIIGSANLSDAALFRGLEWNVRLASSDTKSVLSRMRAVFDSYWNTDAYETYDLSHMGRLEDALRASRGDTKGTADRGNREILQLQQELKYAYTSSRLDPKPHQQRILDELSLRRTSHNEHKNLVVAATGTGKTVIAALDYARLCAPGKPRPRLLFIAHREQILEQARATFRRALRDPSFGDILTGQKNPGRTPQHLFAMVQTVRSRVESLDPEEFEIVYVDEAHHGAAKTWREVIEHLNPRLMIGLTATPERSDGASVAALFGGAYTCELRLWEAVEGQLLAPFDYVGVDDETDLRNLQWSRDDYAIDALSALYTGNRDRAMVILESLERWIEHPSQMRALGFCVSIPHAEFMASIFNENGVASAYLTGGHHAHEREEILAQLAAGKLQVVFSVDVLGEGIDVPDVDTVLLLRPTQSATLFAQQIGRGLRLSKHKKSCLVMDFIGQHRRGYRLADRFLSLIDLSKGSLREQAERGFPFTPGGSSISLERVPRKRVMDSLREFSQRSGAAALRADLERSPTSKLDTFLRSSGRKISEVYAPDKGRMSWTRLQREAGLSSAPSKPSTQEAQRLEEKLLRRIGKLQHVTDDGRVERWVQWLEDGASTGDSGLTGPDGRVAMQLLHLVGLTAETVAAGLDKLRQQESVVAEIVELLKIDRRSIDAIPVPLNRLPDVPLSAHVRYSRSEVFAAMGVSTSEKSFVHQSGTYFDYATRTQLIFVTLNKDNKRFSSSTQYRDYAVSRDLFHWESPNNWRVASDALQRCIGLGSESSLERLLFVRERTDHPIEGRFRFFGQVDLEGPTLGERPVALTWRLQQPLPQNVFDSAALLHTT